MKNALILHATGNNSHGNWYSWLKKELEKNSWNVWLPDLPNADKPNTRTYNEFIFKNKNWQFDEETIIVGHSSGAVAALALLQSLPKNIKVKGCVLVSAFKDDLGWKSLEELFIDPLDFDTIKNHSDSFIFIHSDNDPHCPLEGAQYLSEKVNGKLIIEKGQGHFNLEAGPQFKQFPLLIEIISKEL